jgi:drug/metabolite transporter (DMT)-like permease
MADPSPPAAPHRRQDHLGRAILLMLGSVFSFSMVNVMVKSLTARYSIIEISFFRSLFALAPTAVVVWSAGGLGSLKTNRIGTHVRRALLGVTALFMIFWSFQLLPLADAVALSFTTPLLVTALSGPLLGERVGLTRWSVVLAGLVGVLIMVRPGQGLFQAGALVSLGGALAYALAVISIRDLSQTERPSTIVFYFTALGTLVTGVATPFWWTTPSGEDWLLLIAVGLVAGVAQQIMTTAYSLGPPAVLGAFNYAAILWATLFGWLIFGDLPGLPVIAGTVIIIASGLFLTWRETRRKAAGVPVETLS